MGNTSNGQKEIGYKRNLFRDGMKRDGEEKNVHISSQETGKMTRGD